MCPYVSRCVPNIINNCAQMFAQFLGVWPSNLLPLFKGDMLKWPKQPKLLKIMPGTEEDPNREERLRTANKKRQGHYKREIKVSVHCPRHYVIDPICAQHLPN